MNVSTAETDFRLGYDTMDPYPPPDIRMGHPVPCGHGLGHCPLPMACSCPDSRYGARHPRLPTRPRSQRSPIRQERTRAIRPLVDDDGLRPSRHGHLPQAPS